MTTATIQITPRAFGNIAAAAIALGCDVTTYLVRTAITRTPVIEETPEHRAALPHVAAPAAAPAAAPVRKSAPTTGLLELFGGEEDGDPAAADADPIIHP